MKKLISFTGMLIVCFSGFGADPVIKLDASESLGKVNRQIFGHNIEAADGRDIFCKEGQGFWNPETKSVNPEIVKTVKDLGCGMMRYPGGCYAHNYDWRKYVGPLDKRGNRQFGVDEYIKLCRELGAEPIITISDFALPVAEMPQHAADFVEYLNAPATPEYPWAVKRKEWGNPEPYGVKYFELGNESDHGNHLPLPRFRKYTAQQYVEYANSTIKAMKKIDPSIKTGVVMIPGSGDNYDCDWNKEVLKNATKDADFVVLHFYGPGVGGYEAEDCFKAAMAYPAALKAFLAGYRRLTCELAGKDLPFAVTEYNIGSDKNEPFPQRFSFAAGLLCSEMLQVFMQPDVNVMNAEYWQVSNGWWGMFENRNNVITKRRATLAFYQLWGQHFGGELIKTEILDSPRFESAITSGLRHKSFQSKVNEKEKIRDIPLSPLLFSKNSKECTGAVDGADAFRFILDGLNKESYPEFSFYDLKSLGIPAEGWKYRMSFEAKYSPSDESDRNKLSLGLGFVDSRGYGKVKSAAGTMGLEAAKDWQTFTCVFQSRKDCPGFNILLKVEDRVLPYKGKLSEPAKGKLEIRNLKLDMFPADPPLFYEGLSSTASLSEDGKILHLVIINRSFDKMIQPRIELDGFTAESAESWTVYQDNVASGDYVAPEQKTLKIPVGADTLSLSLPPHSMTIIDFKRRASFISRLLGL